MSSDTKQKKTTYNLRGGKRERRRRERKKKETKGTKEETKENKNKKNKQGPAFLQRNLYQ